MDKYKFTFVVFLVIFCWSCNNDFLEQYPKSEISPENFFRSGSDLKLYTNSLYNALPSASEIYGEDADIMVKADLSDRIQGTRIVPTTGGGWNWSELRKINFYLENSHKCTDEKSRKKYDGIARFFRAFFYFDMVVKFGDVPWYSGTISTNNEDELMKPRDPRTLVLDSILEDINYAIENLELTPKVDVITRWTALALKSRICLFEGTFRKYHKEFNLPDANKFLDECISASTELITNGPYSIYKSLPQTAYMELFSSLNANADEIILARQYSSDLQIYHNLNYYTLTASYGRPGIEKTIVNTYLMSDGSKFTDIDGYDKIQYFNEVKNRDLRLSQTIRTPGYTRIGDNFELAPDFGATVTGYQPIKYLLSPQYDSYNRTSNDIPIFRYAEVLLNFAESKAERGDISQADIDISINQLRDRVGMPNLNLEISNNKPDLYMSNKYKNVSGGNKGIILEIRRERTIELIMEGFRWNDLIRWKEGHLLINQFKGMYFPGLGSYDLDNNGSIDVVIYQGTKPTQKGPQYLKLGSELILENDIEGGSILINNSISKVFDESKDYLFPIPTQERLLNPNLNQNPGWKDGIKN